MIYAVAHHDRGWDDADAAPVLHEPSGYPCGLGTGPVPGVLDTSKRSPDFNEARNAYCGLLSSMHSWGLYNDRYGLSEFSVLGGGKSVPIPPKDEDYVHGRLDGEIARQERLSSVRAADPATAGWTQEGARMRNYKFLQFMDTLALYFNLRHAGDHSQETFVHVPMSEDADTEVTVTPLGDDRYSVTPFPFNGAALEVRCKGRYFEAVSDAPADLGAHLYGLAGSEQVHRLEAA